MPDNWNVETFSQFKCYFNFITENKVRFHFGDEYCALEIHDNIISVTKSDNLNSLIQEVIDYYDHSTTI